MRVCIIGAGLSSYTLAKALVNQNIYVDIFSQKKINLLDKSRTIGISKSNIDFFNNSIINLDKISWKLKKIEIFTENLSKQKLLNFENNKTELFSILKNYRLYELLEKSLSKSKYFKKINLKKKFDLIKNYNLVINTEYSNYITKKYFDKNIIKKYNAIAYTSIIHHQKVQNDVAIQIFTKRGPLAFLPISNSETSVVYSLHKLNREKNIDIINLINKYNFKYKIKKLNQVKSFELKSISLRSYFHNNILAFGDLLHRVHPLAGQGFNMNLRDIKEIDKLIKIKIENGLNLDNSICFDFEKKTKAYNYLFSSGIDLIYELFNIESTVNNNTFSKSVKFLGNKKFLNNFFKKIANNGLRI